MSDQLASGPTTYRNRAEVRVASGPLAGPVLTRVVAMVAARADCPVDRLEDALLVVDAIAAHGPRYFDNGRLSLTVSALQDCLELAVGPVPDASARELLEDSRLPGLGNVLESVADDIRVAPSEHPSDGEVLIVALRFSRG